METQREVHERLTKELCSRIIKHFRNRVDAKEKSFFNRLKMNSPGSFSSQQMSDWLLEIFAEDSIQWENDHTHHVVQYLYENRYLDLRDLPNDIG